MRDFQAFDSGVHAMWPGQQRALGRTEGGQRFGPRPLDLDIVFYEGLSSAHGNLEIPHPRWRERPFVMVLPLYQPTSS